MPIAQDRLLLTEQRPSSDPNSRTLLFMFIRLSKQAGFTAKPFCPSLLRDTYVLAGELPVLQEQLVLVDPASVRRYQRF